jgi:hypothetical protein
VILKSIKYLVFLSFLALLAGGCSTSSTLRVPESRQPTGLIGVSIRNPDRILEITTFSFADRAENEALDIFESDIKRYLETIGYRYAEQGDIVVSIRYSTEHLDHPNGRDELYVVSPDLHSKWSKLNTPLRRFYRHTIIIDFSAFYSHELLWQTDFLVESDSENILGTSNVILKSAMKGFPVRRLDSRKFEMPVINNSREYANRTISRRDFVIPAFDYFITFDSERAVGQKNFKRDIYDIIYPKIDRMSMLPLYVDLLENGSHFYQPKNNSIIILGKYEIDGEVLFAEIEAHSSKNRFRVSRMNLVSETEFSALKLKTKIQHQHL